MTNRYFLFLSHSFESCSKEDVHLSQFGMDTHLGEIVVRESYVEEATRLSHTPSQAVMAEVWKSKVTTVQSVFAALITLDFQRVVDKPTSHLSAAQRGISDVKRRVCEENSFYPFSPKGSPRSQERAVFAPRELPEEFVEQFLSKNGMERLPYYIPGGRIFRKAQGREKGQKGGEVTEEAEKAQENDLGAKPESVAASLGGHVGRSS
ncbi:hypothetical protein PG985_012621 [Apiospora marii]|uniref:uncharacterized protein n=1 Tax=Apiospora marii TaxID=335849 RepID=UPI00312FB629